MTGHLIVHLTFQIGTAFHTTGDCRRLGADKALARDAEGELFIPATTVKGFLRDRAGLLLRTWGNRVCTGPEPQYMCDSREPCVLCRAFGNPAIASRLRFGDARPLTLDSADTILRSGVTVSRHRRAAYPQRLFFVETTSPAPSRWSATVEGRFQDPSAAREAAAIVTMAATWGTAIGGGCTRGLGWVQECRVEAALDGRPIPPDAIEKFWRAWKEGRDVVAD